MKFRQWRTRRAMKDPVRGEFRPTGSYFPHPGRVPMQEMLTGVVSAPGVPPAPGEVLNDLAGGRDGSMWPVLPALVDRAMPSRFVILWDELGSPDYRGRALDQAARIAGQMRRQPPG